MKARVNIEQLVDFNLIFVSNKLKDCCLYYFINKKELDAILKEARIFKIYSYISCQCKRYNNEIHFVILSNDKGKLEEYTKMLNKWNLCGLQREAYFGEILNIPHCCINKYIACKGNLDTLGRALMRKPNVFKVQKTVNGWRHDFLSYLPCSNKCIASLNIRNFNQKYMEKVCREFNVEFPPET